MNDIEVGIDNINNYSGAELSLLVEEKNSRRDQISASSNASYYPIDLANRNIWYRKTKIISYASFVDTIAN